MIAALITLAFIAAAWIGVAAAVELLEKDVARIAAALRGEPLPTRQCAAARRRLTLA